jgi:uncharacterized membrane protein
MAPGDLELFGGFVATLTVWKFPDIDSAERAVEILERMQKEALITVYDAASACWPVGARKPRTRQLMSLTGADAFGGALWGLLFGLIFFGPVLGIAIGAGFGALRGSLSDVGIDDDFIKSARSQITPGTSALFVMSSGAVITKVRHAFDGLEELSQTELDYYQEAKLREAFAG